MDLSPIGIVRIQGGGGHPEHYKESAIQFRVDGKHLKTWKNVKRNLLLTVFFVKSMFDDSHSPFQSGQHACGRGSGKGNADNARNGLLGGISFQMMRFSSICTSAHYR